MAVELLILQYAEREYQTFFLTSTRFKTLTKREKKIGAKTCTRIICNKVMGWQESKTKKVFEIDSKCGTHLIWHCVHKNEWKELNTSCR